MYPRDTAGAGNAQEASRGLILRGRVQGVGFRWWVREAALQVGVRGTVRNLSDGAVEVLVAGSADLVTDFLDRVRQGPPNARVESALEIPCREPLPQGFRIRF